MGTEIRFAEGHAVGVTEEYRDVYEKFLGANWQLPCEFTESGDGRRPITVNPTYVVCFREES